MQILFISISSILCSILCFYYLIYFSKIQIEKTSNTIESETRAFSIIICAHNEYHNLQSLIPILLSQNYPHFEIIIVDHDSKDDTKDFITSFQKKTNRIEYLYCPRDKKSEGKKHALLKGIQAAKYDHLIFTDADCQPQSDRWIELYNQYFHQKEIVLGYGPYQKGPGLLNKIIRFDTFQIGVQYFSFAKCGIAYMGVGRNMAYKKELYLRTGGFQNHLDLKSGDDDLFIQEAAEKNNIGVCLDKEHHCISQAKETWIGFWNQKRRHLSTSTRYKTLHVLLLLLFPSSLVMFYTSIVISIFYSIYLPIALFAFKIILQWICYYKISKVLGEKDLWLLSPLLEFMTVIYNGLVLLSRQFSKSIEWK